MTDIWASKSLAPIAKCTYSYSPVVLITVSETLGEGVAGYFQLGYLNKAANKV
jgi:hypothetical protein